ncbi:alpha/beta hydrolase [Solibacillus sp. A46]|uniref:Alpha/beta hydrolase n=1 Tax=Solibacillus faecavium TaxID=2762221 RepID=A0ABR8XVW4_9BACL|nr:alpha/beta hydrolase [Solibacillus faecavium]MBD8036074.1 alpha/beta hydrolase [Solibacillus faecavium]
MIYYEQYGDPNRPTIILLHGAMAVHTFTQQYSLLKDYHIVLPHLYGAGKSVEILYEPEKLSQEIVELIRSLNKPKVGIIGHSIGAQLAVKLVSDNPELFSFAVFFSANICPNEKTIQMYCKFAPITVKLLRFNWIVKMQGRYWNYSKEQANDMVAYAQKITEENYKAFFTETLNIINLPHFYTVSVPMLAICGERESKDIRESLKLLGENKHCNVATISKAGHDFPMRNAVKINPILIEFIQRLI